MPGKSNQFENCCFLYLGKTKSWWCEGGEEEEGEEEEGEEEEGEEEGEGGKVHLLTHGSTSGDRG